MAPPKGRDQTVAVQIAVRTLYISITSDLVANPKISTESAVEGPVGSLLPIDVSSGRLSADVSPKLSTADDLPEP